MLVFINIAAKTRSHCETIKPHSDSHHKGNTQKHIIILGQELNT